VIVRYLDSRSRMYEDTILGWLLQELPGAHTALISTGYFDAAILDWVEPSIRAILVGGGEVHFIVGSNRGQASIQDLGRLLSLVQQAPGQSTLFVIHLPDALYHPKTYFVERAGRSTALVGSPNFTVAAATRHFETALVVESDHREPPLDIIAASLYPAQTAALANAYQVANYDDLERLANIGVITKERPAPAIAPRTVTGVQRAAARRARFPATGLINGTPAPTARPAGVVVPSAAPPPGAPPQLPPAALPLPAIVVFEFANNDLKETGTREFSVPAGVRDWVALILGGPIAQGQGDLMHVNLYARLAAAPNAVFVSPDQVRLWASGASGGTHFDVRFVIGNYIKQELNRESNLLFGNSPGDGDIGVLELPANPVNQPVRLTVFRQADQQYAVLNGMIGLIGRQKKRQAVLAALPQLPPWPY
jgi:hypothetical protein